MHTTICIHIYIVEVYHTLQSYYHPYFPALGCNRTGQQPGLINTVVLVLLRLPQYVPEAERFDILVLVGVV